MAAETPEAGIIPPPLRYRGSLDLSTHQDNPDPREIEFPIPPSLDGFKKPLPSRKSASKKAADAQVKAASKKPAASASSAKVPAPAGRAGSPAITGSSANAKTAAAQQDAGDNPDTPKKPRKPVEIDAKYLEMMLQRNIGR